MICNHEKIGDLKMEHELLSLSILQFLKLISTIISFLRLSVFETHFQESLTLNIKICKAKLCIKSWVQKSNFFGGKPKFFMIKKSFEGLSTKKIWK